MDLTQINIADLVTAATVAASGAVVVVTQLLKHVPVEWTSRYPLYINIALSLIGTVVTTGLPSFDNWAAFVVQWLVIALAAAITYTKLMKPAIDEVGA
ncbi:hypothetical protein [uncultured Kocuria sp.]|uniref:hypothetical protein n=1 Tax=uncultured Kocuria sp. TaxID=259305 RepID=UPI002613174F|nr:hypothetical protein [uncultured Kocuria sp.]